ncbi:hypothetical protein ACN9M1_18620 [Ralstonia sp. R-29]|uniref:hypothetical protein n=1 Tax=Ralstonia sp. R-29 TaxID=3404059 RepID=UPI003CF81E16
MRHPVQHASAQRPISTTAPATSSDSSDTSRLLADTAPLQMECCGRKINATYSTRNGIVTVKHRGKTLSTYSPDGDYKAVAHRLLCVMLSI